MAKTAKVIDVLGARQWETKTGDTMWSIKLKLDNGDVGEVNKKNEMAFKAGDEITYDLVVDEKYGDKLKEVKKPYEGKGGGYVVEQFHDKATGISLGYAKDLVVGGMTDIKQLLPLADKMYDWMMEKHNKNNTTTPVETSEKDDNLPF